MVRAHRPWRSRAARRLAASEGAVALEFALVAPFFLLLLFGTMIFAIYFATFVAVIHGAAEGARASIGGFTNAERGQLAQARVAALIAGYRPLLDPARVTVTTQATTSGSTPAYRVSVAYPVSDFGFGWFFSFLNAVGGGSASAPQTVSYAVTVANGGY
ncbi:TadE/TadG family type IV pilus assembly protein [Sphingomonas sp.]|uniref:TadE/TadG family type IV pilus assembly protein n=1 Tax=Sphingomonas sp. TaxID=28214 RepID=UPI002C3EDACC|nr:TadE/TadG family type IV pilus assembly protein [Sphingomonas sp.]HWK36264.1 TadE/TadG family type IV pilus assembly protein [Sphingomonas sp.]